jgi:hypothetical protein
MSSYARHAQLDAQDLFTALLETARERMAVRKGVQPFTDHDAVQQLFADDPALYELHRYRVQGGTGLPAHLRQPVVKQNTTVVQAYASLDFQETQDKPLTAARADAITKGPHALPDEALLSQYFQAHPDAYAVYRYKANGGEGLPSHLRGQAVDVRKSVSEPIVLFQKVVDPVPTDLDRLRRLDRPTLYRELAHLTRAEVRRSAELADWDAAAALDVLFSYRQDLYRVWQEKQAA